MAKRRSGKARPMRSTHRIVWTHSAARDVLDIAGYIRQDSPTAAQAFRARIRRAGSTLSRFPTRGRVVPELRELGVMAWHELLIGHYRLIYRVERRFIIIDLVIDARRDVSALLYERLIRTSEM